MDPDRLLPGNQRVPPPFTQEECQQLMGLLQSFNSGTSFIRRLHGCRVIYVSPRSSKSDTLAESSVHTMVHTRVIARILLRAGKFNVLDLLFYLIAT